MSVRPFCKWVGGKRQLLPQLLPFVPAEFGAYHEPFVGGGALFFALASDRMISATLSDDNERLIRTYRAIRDDVEGVIGLLRGYPYDKRFYLNLRAVDIDSRSDVEVAAWFIYLNKTCFNGLYRVNRDDRFNVPFGKFKTAPTILDEENLRACSKVLALAHLCAGDFGMVADQAAAGDFVYFDPPYIPLSVTSSFTSYTAGKFSMKEHARLREVALSLKRRGVYVLLSNSSSSVVRTMYQDDFEIVTVQARRSVNSNADGRGAIAEVLIR